MIDKICSIPDDKRTVYAIGALVIACAILSLDYEYSKFIILRASISFVPNLVSALVAVLLLLPIVRGDFLHAHKLDLLTVLSLLLAFYMIAGLAKIGLGGQNLWSAPGMLFTIVIIALANYRPDKYGELAVIACAIFGGMNLLSANSAMGFWGFLLVLSSFVGILLLVDLRKVWGELSSVPQREDGG